MTHNTSSRSTRLKSTRLSRIVSLLISTVLGLALSMSVVYAQSSDRAGWVPESVLFNQALTLAKAAPFLIALGIIVGIWQARTARLRGGDRIVGDYVVRHDRGTTIAHWVNAIGFILGLATGAVLLRWVNVPLSLETAFALHYVGSALTLFAVFNHLARHGVSGGIGLIPRRLSIIRDTVTEVFEYAGLNGPDRAVGRIPWPKAIRQPIARYSRALGFKHGYAGKYLATEQTLSYPAWAVITAVIVITGLIKTLRYVWPMPTPFIAGVTAVHDIAAIAVAVMLVLHLAPLLLVPANWTLIGSMLTTRVPLKYVKRFHPDWYRELTSQTARQDVPAPAPTAPSPDMVAGLKGGD